MNAEATIGRNEERGVAGKAVELASEMLDVGRKVAHAKSTISHGVEDSMRQARRSMTRGRHLAEDLRDEAALRVRRDPLRAVCVAFTAGAAVSAVSLVALGRAWRRRRTT